MKIYFGIHKHMHQPFYRAATPDFRDGELEGIFSARQGPYTTFIPEAVQQYIDADLPHAGLSTSWSGTLIEQLNRFARAGLCDGIFSEWNKALQAITAATTIRGNPRVDFATLGFYHPLMPLIPHRDRVRQIRMHHALIRRTFGVEASPLMFPPETAFHVRMIPALQEAGVKAVLYDSIHRYRTCREYPYGGIQEGMLPPNPADQTNPPMHDWYQLQNVWAGSKISPGLLKPEYLIYTDPTGKEYRVIGIPAERYIGNEDARGGFGALQYPDVFGQLYDHMQRTGTCDEKHPPFFVLHSDGDNHGGGADSYYRHNTGRLVQWLQEDPRFELMTARDYLELFPPDPQQAVHIEPGSWSGADNGDPQFMKWFSRYNEPYSPDLNSWAVLTALQQAVYALEDTGLVSDALDAASRLMLTAETSCYWYWTGQERWDRQVTDAANAALDLIQSDLDQLLQQDRDRTPPTVFPPWITPENPGGQTWGQGCLQPADPQGVVHTFVDDLAGLKRVTLVMRTDQGEQTRDMTDHGPYPCQTGARRSARYFTGHLPRGAGNIRYYVEAEDQKGNVTHGTLERIYLA